MDVQLLVNSVSSPTLAISADGRVIGANEAFAVLTGQSRDGCLGHYCSEVINAVAADGSAACRHDDCPTLLSLATGTPVQVEWSACLGSDGRHIPVRATTISIPPEERLDGTAALLVMHPEHPVSGTRSAPAPDCAKARVRMMGRPEAWVDGQPRLIRRKRVIELIALLALSDRQGMSRERIVTALWPDAPRGNGRQHLRVLLHALRATLGPGAVESTTAPCSTEELLRLSPSVWADVRAVNAEIDRLRAECPEHAPEPDAFGSWLDAVEDVVTLYRGDLDEAGVCGDWIAPHREQVRGKFLGLLAAAVPLAASTGDVTRAVRYCERAIAADPLDERFQIALLNAYGFLGQRAAAMNQYREYRRILARELALEPPFAVERALREAVGAFDDHLA